MHNFHPLEIVCCGSETQLQVGQKLYKLTLGVWGVKLRIYLEHSKILHIFTALHLLYDMF